MATKAQIEKHIKDQAAEIKKATAETERIDLQNRLDLVKAITEKVIEDLDKEAGAGAAACIDWNNSGESQSSCR